MIDVPLIIAVYFFTSNYEPNIQECTQLCTNNITNYYNFFANVHIITGN